MNNKSLDDKWHIRFGFWSALFSAVFAGMYIFAEVAHLAGLLGVHDRPVSFIVRMVPSLLLSIAFVVLMVSVHYICSSQEKGTQPYRGWVFDSLRCAVWDLLFYGTDGSAAVNHAGARGEGCISGI